MSDQCTNELEKRLRELEQQSGDIVKEYPHHLRALLAEAARIGAEVVLRRIASDEIARQGGPVVTCDALELPELEGTIEGLFARSAELEREECAAVVLDCTETMQAHAAIRARGGKADRSGSGK